MGQYGLDKVVAGGLRPTAERKAMRAMSMHFKLTGRQTRWKGCCATDLKSSSDEIDHAAGQLQRRKGVGNRLLAASGPRPYGSP